jgi:hypothetical protein
MSSRILLLFALGFCLSGCGAGSVHPGDKAYIDEADVLGCDSVEDFTKLVTYATKEHDSERANRELMFTGRCTPFKTEERVTVVGESGDLRQVQRADGAKLWTSWVFVRISLNQKDP